VKDPNPFDSLTPGKQLRLMYSRPEGDLAGQRLLYDLERASQAILPVDDRDVQSLAVRPGESFQEWRERTRGAA
jgi:hypothetical protein